MNKQVILAKLKKQEELLERAAGYLKQLQEECTDGILLVCILNWQDDYQALQANKPEVDE